MQTQSGQMLAGGPLLATKCFVPRWRPALVSRSRLTERLQQGASRRLTLVAAPAGFGKTTLLAEWLATCPATDRSTAWVSLDAGDNDPVLFWTYVVTALQSAQTEFGATVLAQLTSPNPPPLKAVLANLINDLIAVEREIVLVLDDLHVVSAPEVHEGLAFLLDHLPPHAHIVIASRADPPLPLSRLRVRGDLTELRAADLRFTPDEAAAFLNDVMQLSITSTDVAALETRTEGWIAGLQLAALSMQGRADVSSFIDAFVGGDRYIVDYLVEEVLQRQPEHIRNFLLSTAILDRLTGGLCDAVTGEHDGRQMLETLERANLFVVPLDDRRAWYRYHHLFADVLRARLRDEAPAEISALHGRASAWYEAAGFTADAIAHAFAAGEVGRAADMIERARSGMGRSRQEATLLAWIRALPPEEIRVRPVLSATYGAVLLQTGHIEGVEKLLANAERWLEHPSPEMIVADEAEFRHLPASLAVLRAGMSLGRGDADAAAEQARRALKVVTPDDFFDRGAATAIVGLAAWRKGDLETAYESYAEGMDHLYRAGYVADTVGGTLGLADILIAQGRLREAKRTFESALQRAVDHGTPAMRGTADMHVGLAELHLEWNDFDTARRHLQESRDLGEAASFPQNPYRWRVATARLREAEGDLDAACVLLDEAERRYVSDFHPNVRPIGAIRAQIHIAQGRLAESFAWARERRLDAAAEPTYVQEFEYITLARALIARYEQEADAASSRDAAMLLDRLLAIATGHHTWSELQILVLQARLAAVEGDLPGGLVALERALLLAEPEGYVRLFIAEGDPIHALLRRAASTSGYARRLLEMIPVAGPGREAASRPPGLAEALTARELEILQLIAAGLRNEEIADRLFISLATVKRHIANTYGKLEVSHRTEAVARANALNLL